MGELDGITPESLRADDRAWRRRGVLRAMEVGQLPLREISQAFGVSDATAIAWAKRAGVWEAYRQAAREWRGGSA